MKKLFFGRNRMLPRTQISCLLPNFYFCSELVAPLCWVRLVLLPHLHHEKLFHHFCINGISSWLIVLINTNYSSLSTAILSTCCWSKFLLFYFSHWSMNKIYYMVMNKIPRYLVSIQVGLLVAFLELDGL